MKFLRTTPGTPSTIEETSLVLQALGGSDEPAIGRGLAWLIEATDEGRQTPPSPIGLYFASLWYFEELYPLTFATGALTRCEK